MLKKKILANNISNLTDARYFAAMGVDYISFDINPESDSYIGLEDIKEITEWIEGPNYLLQLPTSIVADQLFEISDKLKMDGFIIEKQQEILAKNFPNAIIFCYQQNKLQPKNQVISFQNYSPTNPNVWVEIKSVEQLKTLINDPISGIILSGGKEEKLGFKAYDELDNIFDLLELD